MKYKKTMRDLILIAVVLAVAGGFYLGNRVLGRQPAAFVEITIDGTVVKELDLSQNAELVIDSPGGGTNTLMIEGGTVRVTDASCPDKLCMHQGKINESGEMIVCLPNRMIAKIVGTD